MPHHWVLRCDVHTRMILLRTRLVRRRATRETATYPLLMVMPPSIGKVWPVTQVAPIGKPGTAPSWRFRLAGPPMAYCAMIGSKTGRSAIGAAIGVSTNPD